MGTVDTMTDPDRGRISSIDPEIALLTVVVRALDPLDRLQQLRVMAAVCAQLGEYNFAECFIQGARNEELQRTVES